MAELLGDGDETPEPQNDDKRADLFDDAVRQKIDKEAADDDGAVEAGEPRAEVSSRNISFAVLAALRTMSQL